MEFWDNYIIMKITRISQNYTTKNNNVITFEAIPFFENKERR